MKRLADIVAMYVQEAVAGLPVLEAEREVIEWEVLPFVNMLDGGTVSWVVGIGLPVPETGDSIMPFAPVGDPHSKDEVARVVGALHQAAAKQVSAISGKVRATANGHGKSPGGLIVP
jgi:hypothetical protein